ncbi:MAG TPA: GHKL domain-containing protein [Candidatus Limosilactobacillus faecipullorum]|nr:GHKL domain-containing protein [Candidatus Limosilactobacillus faecipullorum]
MLTLALVIHQIIPFTTSLLFFRFFRIGSHIDSFIIVGYMFFTWLVTISLALLVRKWLDHLHLPVEDQQILTLQFAFFLLFTIIFAEVFRFLKIFWTYQFLIAGILIFQLVFSLFLTYFSIHKNRERLEIDHLKEQIKMTNLYTTNLEKNYREMRKFRHDYKNLLAVIKVQDNQANQAYLNEIIKYSNQTLNHSVTPFAQLSNLKLPAIKSLVITKLLQAEQQKLNVKFECLRIITKINLPTVTLVRIMGILLDNAIEAAVNSSTRKLTVLFITIPKGIEISIENTYQGEIPTIAKMHRPGFTSKPGHRGIGLSNVNEILAKYPQVELTHYLENNHFYSSLIIRKDL